MMIVIIIAVVVVLALGAFAVYWFAIRDDKPDTPPSTQSTTAQATETPSSETPDPTPAGGGDTPTPTTPGTGSTLPSGGSGGLNEKVQAGCVSYTVTAVKTATEYDTYESENGVYVIATTSITNDSSNDLWWFSSEVMLVAADGTEYDTNYATDIELLLSEIGVGQTLTGDLVYDVPEAAVAGSVLSCGGCADQGDKPATITTGL
jgi:cytoskeletal protein RodZ